MPIPESEAFKARKPTVPPTFDGVDYNDQVALKKAQDAIIREQWVRSMMARLVREELGRCYRREGVNHLARCGALRERYLELLKESKIRGYLFEQQNYISRDGAPQDPPAAVEGQDLTTQAMEKIPPQLPVQVQERLPKSLQPQGQQQQGDQ